MQKVPNGVPVVRTWVGYHCIEEFEKGVLPWDGAAIQEDDVLRLHPHAQAVQKDLVGVQLAPVPLLQATAVRGREAEPFLKGGRRMGSDDEPQLPVCTTTV